MIILTSYYALKVNINTKTRTPNISLNNIYLKNCVFSSQVFPYILVKTQRFWKLLTKI